jgi:transcriptional regulator with AAA-type ATPase domain
MGVSRMSITVNLIKAKDIAKNNLRTERTSILASLDVQFMRAVESGNTELQTAIAAQKQALRDITANESIVNAEDADTLKASMNTLIEQIKS